MAFREYGNYDGVGLAELVRKKQVSAPNCWMRRSRARQRSIRKSTPWS